jgi:dTDP-4-dehydrorhamnose 3,5-epimerase-like enzyme
MTGHAQPRPGLDARRNSHFEGALAFDAALPAAFYARVANYLPDALARRACARENDPDLNIDWQLESPPQLSEKDTKAVRFREAALFP